MSHAVHQNQRQGTIPTHQCCSSHWAFSFAAPPIDGGHAQNAADMAVLAATPAKIRGQHYLQTGENRAVSNGYSNNDADTTVEVHLCSEAGVSCGILPDGAIAESAVARVHGSASITSGSLFEGAVLVATRSSSARFDPFACGGNNGVSHNISASTFQDISTTLIPPTCSTPDTHSGNTFSAGSFNGITINSNPTAVFNPGV